MRLWIAGLAFVALALRTADRVSVWESDQTLWADAVQTAPDKPRPWINLAGAEWMAGNYGVAELHLDRAELLAEHRTGWEQVHGEDLVRANRALLLLSKGAVREAWALVQHARAGTASYQVCQRYGGGC